MPTVLTGQCAVGREGDREGREKGVREIGREGWIHYGSTLCDVNLGALCTLLTISMSVLCGPLYCMLISSLQSRGLLNQKINGRKN
jgi:hypothetical protein